MLANLNVNSSAYDEVKRIITGIVSHDAAYTVSEEVPVKVRVGSAKQGFDERLDLSPVKLDLWTYVVGEEVT